jgi:hydrogenase-4 component F
VTTLIASFLPLVAVLAALLPATRARAHDVLALVAFVSVALMFGAVPAGGPGALELSGGYLVDDALARMFIAIDAVVLLGVSLHVHLRATTSPHLAPGLPRFVGFTGLFMVAANLALVSNDLVLAWVFVEATTLFAAPLIHHGDRPGSHRAAWRYLLFSTVGLTIAFLGFVCLAKGMELQAPDSVTFRVDELVSRADLGVATWRRLGLLFLVFGYGTKIGLAPMNAWVVETYDAAPPSVTTLLAATQATTVFAVLSRVLQAYRHAEPDLVSGELLVMGLLTMLVSTLRIVSVKNVKRLISCAAMTHNGILAVGLAVGQAAAFGSALYLASNALVKGLLFLACGAIVARFHTKDTKALHGLIRAMPVSGSMLMIGTFALLGFAPFGSFVGEVMILAGVIQTGAYVVFAAFCIMLTIILVAMGRSMFPMIWGAPPDELDASGRPKEPSATATTRLARVARRESLGSLVPAMPFVVLLLALGLYPPPAIHALLVAVARSMGGS